MSHKEDRYVYSACCTWHGPITEAKSYTSKGIVIAGGKGVEFSLPGCPHCGSPLYEYESRAIWDENIRKFMEQHPDMPLYAEWMESLKKEKCVQLKDFEDWKERYKRWAGSLQ